jgi:hypothetical protein
MSSYFQCAVGANLLAQNGWQDFLPLPNTGDQGRQMTYFMGCWEHILDLVDSGSVQL